MQSDIKPGRIALLITGMALTAAGVGTALAKQAAPTGPVAVVGAFLGRWHAQGVSHDTTYSKAGHDSADTVCGWAATGDYLVCSQDVHTDAGPSHALSIFSYDAAQKQYCLYSIPDPGRAPHKMVFTVDGHTWTYPFEYDDGGKHIFGRTVNVFDRPGHVTYQVQYSTDQKTWVTGAEGTETRVSNS